MILIYVDLRRRDETKPLNVYVNVLIPENLPDLERMLNVIILIGYYIQKQHGYVGFLLKAMFVFKILQVQIIK